jgi:hypothetical protein
MGGLDASSFDDEKWLAVLYGLPVFAQDPRYDAAFVRFDLIENFHGFDDADGVAFFDRFAGLDKRLRRRS